jgi:hypothetical protein
MKKSNLKFLSVLFALIGISIQSNAQFLMDMSDTSQNVNKNMLGLYSRFNRIKLSGYIQPQFQYTDTAGAKSYGGGDFSQLSNNRFMMRRGRIRMDYVKLSKNNSPTLQFVFQYDISERGVFMRDFWGRVFDTKYNLFSFTIGMFARPFGHELNLGSADRESPERGRMSQILMKIERDLGAMISFEPRKVNSKLNYLKLDFGLFNGPGLTATTDYDSKKDVISRLSLKPYPITKKIIFSTGASFYSGGILQNSKYRASMYNDVNGNNTYSVDSTSFKGKYAPRKYYGYDFQLKLKHKWGATEFRGEIITGTQSSYASTSETPSSITVDSTSANMIYKRTFTGAYAYFLQNIINPKHQIVVKYDFYDPNNKVKGQEIGAKSTNLKNTDIKYSTIGLGYVHYFNENLKVVFYYDIVKNEKTNLTGFTKDLKDNLITTRIQFKF